MTVALGSLSGRAAMVGAATAGMGKVRPGRSFMEITADAVQAAVSDAGVALHEVDGVFGASMSRLMFPIDLTEYLGLNPRFVDGTQIGGASFEAHCLSAALALDRGLCNVALIAFGATTRSGRGPWPAQREFDPHLDAYGIEGLNTYALAAARHMHEYGTTRAQLADVAVAARRWAQLNPAAFKRDPLTRDEVLASKFVSTPLTAADCCLVTDGAAAVVMMRADEARARCRHSVALLGAGIGLSHINPSQVRDLTTTSARVSAARAFEMAGIGPADIDVVQLYDAFTINVILFLEDLGFCAKGEGGAFVADGAIAPGGRLPVNTNGGGLSCVHPGMYGLFMLVEAFEQLTGRAEARQIAHARTALCHGNGGNLSAQVTTLWGHGDVH